MPSARDELFSGVDLTKLKTKTEMARSLAVAERKRATELADAARVSVHVEKLKQQQKGAGFEPRTSRMDASLLATALAAY